MGERARFYRNKEGRWAFNCKYEHNQVFSQALLDRGLSPEEIKVLTHLTEASIALVPSQNNKVSEEAYKKHTSLPLTQAIMNQKLI